MSESKASPSAPPSTQILARDRNHGRPLSRRPLRAVLADMERSAAVLAESGDEAAGRVGAAIAIWLAMGSAASLGVVLGIEEQEEGGYPAPAPASTTAPVLMRRNEILTLARAAVHARRSEVQIRRWCKQHGISRQATPTSPHEISILGLEMVLHGDWEALRLLRAGARSAPEVQRYVDFLGLSNDKL